MRDPSLLAGRSTQSRSLQVNAFETERLRDDHRRLDEGIERRLRRRWTDPTELQQLKKRKLALKDRLHRASRLDRLATQAA
jgi:hypothetical protein